MSGIDEADFSGLSVSSAGEVKGDGFADLIVGAPFADPGAVGSGASYVVFGFGTSASETLDIAGVGNDSLKLSMGDVLDVSDESNPLLVDGNAGDMMLDHSGSITETSGDTNGNGASTGQTY